MDAISILFLLAVGLPTLYLYVLVLASVRTRSARPCQQPRHRFAIAIPAHDEEAVIGRTVANLRQLDYPSHLYEIHIVADHCTDRTAQLARSAGAIVHERHEEPRGSKGAALRWLFRRIFQDAIRNPQSAIANHYDAVVIFDADTQVHPQFLRIMDARLSQGDQVIQGQHRISNPDDGWFPALTWAMFMVDNRFQNQGRSNLGWSAKNMGDSICFRADVLRRLGWGEGLTEDYEFRQKLLLEGIRITYEPAAVGYGEAPATLAMAQKQRARWLRGASDASRRYGCQMLREAVRRRDMALLDGALQATLPSYSTLTLLAVLGFVLQILGPTRPSTMLTGLWGGILAALFVYPWLGLALERASVRAYLAIMTGPLFVLWRTWLAIRVRFTQKAVPWVRTPHGTTKG